MSKTQLEIILGRSITTSNLPLVLDGIKGGATLTTAGAAATGVVTKIAETLLQTPSDNPRVAFATVAVSAAFGLAIHMLQRAAMPISISPHIIKSGFVGCCIGVAGCISGGSQLADHWQEAVKDKQAMNANIATSALVPFSQLDQAKSKPLTFDRD